MTEYLNVICLTEDVIKSITTFPVVDNSKKDIQKAEEYFKQKVREIATISDDDLEFLLDDGYFENEYKSVEIIWSTN